MPCTSFITHQSSVYSSLKRAATGEKYRFFLSSEPQRDERTLFSPLASSSPLLFLSSPLLLRSSSSSLIPCYPQTGCGGGRGAGIGGGGFLRSWEQNTDQQLMPRLFSKNPIDPELCADHHQPDLLSLLTSICCSIIC